MQKKRLLNDGPATNSGFSTPAKHNQLNKLNPANLPRVNNTIKPNKGMKSYDLSTAEPMHNNFNEEGSQYGSKISKMGMGLELETSPRFKSS
jgi:hypothetical protein